jgi:phosphate starvation-inducible PhoH-like protein
MNFRKVYKIIITSLLIIIPQSSAFIYPSLSKKFSICEAKRVKYTEDIDGAYEEPSKKFKYLYKPRTSSQTEYVNMIQDNKFQLVIGNGPAGTGKTLFPTQEAVKLLKFNDTKIIITRPLISADEELGFLPGNINKKMDPWIVPIFDVLREYFTQSEINGFMGEKRLEIVPLAFMRGRTFKNSFIIADELQNTSIKQMLMLLTRLGENSKMIITGDINQCDNSENGLQDFLQKLNLYYIHAESTLKEDFIGLINFNNNDIQRSEIINLILRIYE